jgi:hypothetical protein
MPIGTILLIILILALVGVIPVWPHKPVLGGMHPAAGSGW